MPFQNSRYKTKSSPDSISRKPAGRMDEGGEHSARKKQKTKCGAPAASRPRVRGTSTGTGRSSLGRAKAWADLCLLCYVLILFLSLPPLPTGVRRPCARVVVNPQILRASGRDIEGSSSRSLGHASKGRWEREWCEYERQKRRNCVTQPIATRC
jgi:hypothetical protein